MERTTASGTLSFFIAAILTCTAVGVGRSIFDCCVHQLPLLQRGLRLILWSLGSARQRLLTRLTNTSASFGDRQLVVQAIVRCHAQKLIHSSTILETSGAFATPTS